jgi:hypothetical protein
MKNGDRLTCEIKGFGAGKLSVKLGYVNGTIGLHSTLRSCFVDCSQRAR